MGQPEKGAEVATTGAKVVELRPGETKLTVQPGQGWWTQPQLDALRTKISGDKQPTDADWLVYLHLCVMSGLDPFRNEIHYVGRKDSNAPNGVKWTAQTGIDGFRHIAERTGEFGGRLLTQWCGTDGEWRDVWLHDEPPAAARVAVIRRGFDHPFYGTAMYREFVPLADKWTGARDNRRKVTDANGDPVREPMGLWGKMPAHMLAKCAEAQAIRAAFPRQTGGLYEPAEMDQATAAEQRAAARDAVAARSWARSEGVEIEVHDAQAVYPPRQAMLEELANQAKVTGRTLAQWTTRWAAAHRKNVEEAEDRELWDLILSRREMVAAHAAETGQPLFLCDTPAGPEVVADGDADAVPNAEGNAVTDADAEHAQAEAEPPARTRAPRGKGKVVDAEVVPPPAPEPEYVDPPSASYPHRFREDEDQPAFCGFMGCQLPENDPTHIPTPVDGQESLL